MSQPVASRDPLTVPPIWAAVRLMLSRTKPVAVHVAPSAVVVIERPAGTATTRAAAIRASRKPIVRSLSIHPPPASRKFELNESLIRPLRLGPRAPLLVRFRQVDGVFHLLAEVASQRDAGALGKLADSLRKERDLGRLDADLAVAAHEQVALEPGPPLDMGGVQSASHSKSPPGALGS